MGDEGVGVHAVRYIEEHNPPGNVDCLDGGTGGLNLLEPMQNADHVIIIDATMDDAPAGTVRRLSPKFANDYPVALSAHDIGLRDLLDVFYLLGKVPKVTLYAISIAPLPDGLSLELSAEIKNKLPKIKKLVFAEISEQNRSFA